MFFNNKRLLLLMKPLGLPVKTLTLVEVSVSWSHTRSHKHTELLDGAAHSRDSQPFSAETAGKLVNAGALHVQKQPVVLCRLSDFSDLNVCT